jgi:hypothetical protein
MKGKKRTRSEEGRGKVSGGLFQNKRDLKDIKIKISTHILTQFGLKTLNTALSSLGKICNYI